MRRVLTIAAAFAFLPTPTIAHAGTDWRVVAVAGDVYAEGGDSVVAGSLLDSGTIIQTGATGHLTLTENGRSIAVGPNAQVRLLTDGIAQVERGSATLHDPGAARDRVITASSPAQSVATSPPQTSGARVSSAVVSHAQVSRTTTVASSSPPPSDAPRNAAPSQSASSSVSYVSAPSPRAIAGAHVMGSPGISAPHRTHAGDDNAPHLRATSNRDFDAPPPSARTSVQLNNDNAMPSMARRNLDQQARTAQAALADANRQALVTVNTHAADRLLDRVTASDGSSKWNDKPQSIANDAAFVMAAVIMLQLLSMGLLALWRYTRKAKSDKPEPRWRSI